MKLNLKQKFINLKGEEIKTDDKTAMLGEVLANIILTPHKNKEGFRPLKAWELAQRFYKNDACEIEMADFIQIKEIVENNEDYQPFIIAQVLEYLFKAEKN